MRAPCRPRHLSAPAGPHYRSGFTLIETLVAIALFALLAGALYSVTTAAIEATNAAIEGQATEERLDTFLNAIKRALLNLPADGTIALRYDTTGGAGTPELVFRGNASPFGVGSLAGGEMVLSARPQSDGTRTFSLLRIPKETSTTDLNRLRNGNGWLPLLPRVEKVEWAVFDGGEWVPEWDTEGRPRLIRLRFVRSDEGDVVESLFWVPPAADVPDGDAPLDPGTDGNNAPPAPTPEP
ncbi:MAG: hypothetical protein Fur0032_19770 [Terrimicrobiaceae bacterium]